MSSGHEDVRCAVHVFYASKLRYARLSARSFAEPFCVWAVYPFCLRSRLEGGKDETAASACAHCACFIHLLKLGANRQTGSAGNESRARISSGSPRARAHAGVCPQHCPVCQKREKNKTVPGGLCERSAEISLDLKGFILVSAKLLVTRAGTNAITHSKNAPDPDPVRILPIFLVA